jgi:mannose-1-phosphate guanylyltransferase
LVIEEPEKIVFIGQKPRFANQNVGYIEFGKEIKKEDGIAIHAFTGFQYSPPLETARVFATDNKHAWNLGYFTTTPKYLWKLFEQFVPDLFKQLEQINKSYLTKNYEKVLADV